MSVNPVANQILADLIFLQNSIKAAKLHGDTTKDTRERFKDNLCDSKVAFYQIKDLSVEDQAKQMMLILKMQIDKTSRKLDKFLGTHIKDYRKYSPSSL